eukprot:429458-Pleurochrysis_carterae.AAC.1
MHYVQHQIVTSFILRKFISYWEYTLPARYCSGFRHPIEPDWVPSFSSGEVFRRRLLGLDLYYIVLFAAVALSQPITPVLLYSSVLLRVVQLYHCPLLYVVQHGAADKYVYRDIDLVRTQEGATNI